MIANPVTQLKRNRSDLHLKRLLRNIIRIQKRLPTWQTRLSTEVVVYGATYLWLHILSCRPPTRKKLLTTSSAWQKNIPDKCHRRGHLLPLRQKRKATKECTSSEDPIPKRAAKDFRVLLPPRR